MNKVTIPTGYLFSDIYPRGELETLSIGDYGKQANVKAKFLGLDREINGVANQKCMPLQEKWVITVSTQYGCAMKCNFCDVPKLKYKGNASEDDLRVQLQSARECFPEIKYTERLNLHFARMGDPLYNKNVFSFAEDLMNHKLHWQDFLDLSIETLHPVLTTSMPKGLKSVAKDRLLHWADIKNNLYNGQAGLQISINSTSDEYRNAMFNNGSMQLEEIAVALESLPFPVSRKYCLNFAITNETPIDGNVLKMLFDPKKFMCKITPIHNNTACSDNGYKTVDGYKNYHPYKRIENEMLLAGFDVLVFIPSMDEEDGLITCGNLALSGADASNVCLEPNISGLSSAST